jgi:hypothetical protein
MKPEHMQKYNKRSTKPPVYNLLSISLASGERKRAVITDNGISTIREKCDVLTIAILVKETESLFELCYLLLCQLLHHVVVCCCYLFPAIFPCALFFFLPPPSRPLLRCETQLLPARARLQQAGRQAKRNGEDGPAKRPTARTVTREKGGSRGERTFTRGHVHALFHDALETAFTWDPLTTQCLTDACHSMIFCYYCFFLGPFSFFITFQFFFFPFFFSKIVCFNLWLIVSVEERLLVFYLFIYYYFQFCDVAQVAFHQEYI